MNKIQSMFKMNCPVCRKGKMFVAPFNFSQPLKMHDRCEVCDSRMEPEPGYYFGAMYISYIWTGSLCLFTIGTTMIVFNWTIGQSFALLISLFVVSFFWVMRISRSMYAHLDMKYKPNAAKNNNLG